MKGHRLSSNVLGITAGRFRARGGIALVVTVVAALAAMVLPAHATYPGTNGLIVYLDSQCEAGACTSSMYTTSGAGGQTRAVLDKVHYDAQPSWSPDGRRIVYLGASGHIFVAKADGSGRRRVTATADFQRENPTFAPSGRRILYGTFDAKGDSLLFSVKLDGTDRRRVARGVRGDLRWPVYSPTGGRIAFSYFPPGARDPYGSGIYTAKPDGTRLRRITAASNQDREPSWSPNGRLLAFYRVDESRRSVQVFRVRADGTGLRKLTSLRKANAIDPVWSPDGRRIAYVREGVYGDEIWTMKADGSDHQRVGAGNQPDWQAR